MREEEENGARGLGGAQGAAQAIAYALVMPVDEERLPPLELDDAAGWQIGIGVAVAPYRLDRRKDDAGRARRRREIFHAVAEVDDEVDPRGVSLQDMCEGRYLAMGVGEDQNAHGFDTIPETPAASSEAATRILVPCILEERRRA